METTQSDPDEIPCPDDLVTDSRRENWYNYLRDIADTTGYLSQIVPTEDRLRVRMRYYNAGSQRGLNVRCTFEDLGNEQTKIIVRTTRRW